MLKFQLFSCVRAFFVVLGRLLFMVVYRLTKHYVQTYMKSCDKTKMPSYHHVLNSLKYNKQTPFGTHFLCAIRQQNDFFPSVYPKTLRMDCAPTTFAPGTFERKNASIVGCLQSCCC